MRWDPFREVARLQDEMSRLFGESWFSPRGSGREDLLQSAWAPPVDIYEDGEAITLKFDLPEVDPKDVDIRVENGYLTLRGERRLEKEDKRDNYARIERFHGAFTRSFSLPPTVNAEKIMAESKNGVLRVYLPKREETKPKQIQVKVQ
jgi:HSP20 family protein